MKTLNIVVLDYSTTQIAIYNNVEVTSDANEDVESFIVSQGHHLSNCNFMTSESELHVDYL